MEKNRLEAFSDGVIAIIITIMVLELKVPHETDAVSVLKITPKFVSYVFSFLVVAIMWINHHQNFYNVKKVDGTMLWTNINLLFWMSLIPFVTAFIGENPLVPTAVALYGTVLSFSVISFTLLRFVISRHQRDNLELTVQNNKILRKNLFSNFLYLLSVPLAFVSVYLSFFIFVLIPVLYFIPEKISDKQFENDVD
ncbi:MAG: TMEM175 family protein [Acidobacteriota bacterium]